MLLHSFLNLRTKVSERNETMKRIGNKGSELLLNGTSQGASEMHILHSRTFVLECFYIILAVGF